MPKYHGCVSKIRFQCRPYSLWLHISLSTTDSVAKIVASIFPKCLKGANRANTWIALRIFACVPICRKFQFFYYQ
ncbi:hypothetical protein ACTXT7_012736 [Hymenolepis weldensis]